MTLVLGHSLFTKGASNMKQFRVIFAVASAFLSIGLTQAAPVSFTATLSGPAESPANASPGTGSATMVFDTALHTLSINVVFSGLTGTTTASHIHCCTATPGAGTAGVATETPTFGGFPLGVSSGSYSNIFDLTLASSFNAAFITANGGTPGSAELALFNGSVAGRSYLNVHSSAFAGGEIRGFLQPSAVPVPSSMLLLGLGLASLATLRKYRRMH
jgi:CHRD domain/PEP-CTERM motif